jgi:hypothetical protein
VSRYIEEHRGRFGVEPICSVLGVSASAYYQRKTGARSARSLEDERLLGRIREVHEANYCAYGYRRTSLPPTGLSTLGFDAGCFPPTPPACYPAPWRLPGPDFHRHGRCELMFRSDHQMHHLRTVGTRINHLGAAVQTRARSELPGVAVGDTTRALGGGELLEQRATQTLELDVRALVDQTRPL